MNPYPRSGVSAERRNRWNKQASGALRETPLRQGSWFQWRALANLQYKAQEQLSQRLASTAPTPDFSSDSARWFVNFQFQFAKRSARARIAQFQRCPDSHPPQVAD